MLPIKYKLKNTTIFPILTAGLALFVMLFGISNLHAPFIIETGEEILISLLGIFSFFLYEFYKDIFLKNTGIINTILVLLILLIVLPFCIGPKCICLTAYSINSFFPNCSRLFLKFIFCISIYVILSIKKYLIDAIAKFFALPVLLSLGLLIIIRVLNISILTTEYSSPISNIETGENYNVFVLIVSFLFYFNIKSFMKKKLFYVVSEYKITSFTLLACLIGITLLILSYIYLKAIDLRTSITVNFIICFASMASLSVLIDFFAGFLYKTIFHLHISKQQITIVILALIFSSAIVDDIYLNYLAKAVSYLFYSLISVIVLFKVSRFCKKLSGWPDNQE